MPTTITPHALAAPAAKKPSVLAQVENILPSEAIEELREAFVTHPSQDPGEIAARFGIAERVLVALVQEQKWDTERDDYATVLDQTERLRYRERIRAERLPVVERQLVLVETLHKLIEKSARKLSDPTPDQVKRLADALEKTSNVAGRILNIRENLFEPKPNGPAATGGNNVFIMPGAKAQQSPDRRATFIDVSEEAHPVGSDES